MDVEAELDKIADSVKNCIRAGMPLAQLTTAQLAIIATLPADAKAKVGFCKRAGIKLPYASELLPCGTCHLCVTGKGSQCEADERIYAIATLVGMVGSRRATRLRTATLAAYAGAPWGLVHNGKHVTVADFARRKYDLSDPVAQDHERQVEYADCTMPLIVADCTDEAGQWYWVLDGCHRTCAALRRGYETLPAALLTDAEVNACELSKITWPDFLQSLCDPRAAWTHI